MPEDAYGNYQAGLEPGPSLPASVNRLRSGAGAPASSLGNVGDGYINQSNGDWYTKKTVGWELQAGGGGGGVEIEAGSFADPNVALLVPADPSNGAIYTQDGADLINAWRWDVTGQVWYQLLA